MNLYLVKVTKTVKETNLHSFILAFGKDELKTKMLSAGFYESDYEKVLDGYVATTELNPYCNNDKIEGCMMDFTKLPFGDNDEVEDDN